MLVEVQRIVSSIFPDNSAEKNKNPCKFSLETILVNNLLINPKTATCKCRCSCCCEHFESLCFLCWKNDLHCVMTLKTCQFQGMTKELNTRGKNN